MGETSIGWTDRSINPIRARHRNTGAKGHHCEKVSPGCQNCYASAMQTRFGLPEFSGPSRREQVALWLDESKLAEVLRRKKPAKWFWCDMTDLFGDWVPLELIAKCFAVMALTPWHTHQVLTKRPEQMRRFVAAPNAQETVEEVAFAFSHENLCGGMFDGVSENWPLPNVWLGVSVENQQTADERIPLLLQTPAAVRFLSVEPLLEPVNLWCINDGSWYDREGAQCYDALRGHAYWRNGEHGLSGGPRVDWVIIGGESSKNRRPCEVAWIADLARQCQAAGVACFIKQDCALRPGQQGRIPDELWRLKQFPVVGPDGLPPPY